MADDEITVTEAAALLNVTTHAIRDLIRRQRLPARRFGPMWRRTGPSRRARGGQGRAVPSQRIVDEARDPAVARRRGACGG